MTVSEKVAYLKGLMEGLNIGTETPEGKLFAAMADTLQEISDEIDDLNATLEDHEDELDAISDALDDIAEDLYAEDDEDEDDEDEDWDEDWDDEDLYGVTCPNCDAEIHVSAAQVDEGQIVCPKCGELLELEFDDEEEDDEDDEDDKDDKD